MKQGIHPTFNNDCQVSCACGNSFQTGSVMKSISTEICSNCHPFYTGKQKLVDTLGTVDKFKKKLVIAENLKATKTEKKPRVKKEKKTV